VDELITGLTVTANSVPLRSVVPILSSYKVNANAVYTFNVQNSYPLPAASIIKVVFPPSYTQAG
jgi:hypothetical protein